MRLQTTFAEVQPACKAHEGAPMKMPLLAAASTAAVLLVPTTGVAQEPRPVTAETIGEVASDLVFVPLPPCRIIDTRIAGGILAAGVQRDFEVSGTADFTAQGGTVGGCGIPQASGFRAATAAAINFVAIDATGKGNLQAWEFGQPIPTASILNYNAINTNLANAVIVPIVGDGNSAKDLSVRANVSAVHLVADVTGYFRRPQFNASELIVSSASSLAAGDCVTLASCTIVSDPTNVEVSIVARVKINHGTSGNDAFWLSATAGTASCPNNHLSSSHVVPAALPAATDYGFTVPHQRRFSHTGGTVTYYATAQMAFGASSGDEVTSLSMICTSVP
jgi:hypothetical protein